MKLWEQIRDFDIDGGPVRFSYAQRLAKENRWSAQHARRVVEEYKKFLFLAAEAGHPVSPSDAVDQAWHLHMLYTESYWNRLGRDILPKPLHHGPTKGGQKEADKFEDWYAKTLASYRRLFNQEPPEDIWPRQKKKQTFQRVDTQDHWVLPKRPLKLGAVALVATVAVIGCEANTPAPAFVPLVFFGIAGAFVLIAIAKVMRQNGHNGGSTGCSSTYIHTSCGNTDSHGHSGHGGHDGHSGDGHDGGSDGGDGGGGDGGGCGGGCGGD